MIPPLVSFTAWNRLGLTARNLAALLNTPDDFELHIVDNNSRDDTWSYLQSLNDSRIVSLTRFAENRGPVYAVNFNLAKRKENQFFITVDNDVHILTPLWVSKFMAAFESFPELGLLGAIRREYYRLHPLTAVCRKQGDLCCHLLDRGFVEGCCQCLHPELIKYLGYWSEENCMGDRELCYRLLKCTNLRMGYFPSVEIDQTQSISCGACGAREFCTLRESGGSCFRLYKEKNVNPLFRNRFCHKFEKCCRELDSGERSAFCASIHDGRSLEKTGYDRRMAKENFSFYAEHGN